MAERTKHDIWNDGDGAGREQGRPGKVRRFLTFFLTLAAVLAVVLAAAYRDGTGFDALRRYLNYGGSKNSGEACYRYDASTNNRFAALGDRLVVLSDASLRLLDKDGGEIWSALVNMSAPALVQGGGRAVAYDIGGRLLYVLDRNGEVFHLTMEEEEPLISAALNDRGMLTVTAEKKDYKGAVYVYNEALEKVLFEFKSAERFVTDACVTGSGSVLAAVTLGQEDGRFVSNVLLYDLREAGEKTPFADYSVPDGLVLSMGEQSGKLASLSDTCLAFASPSGEVEAVYGYGGAYLRGYGMGDDFTALLLNRYQAGNVGRLVTVDADGEELGSIDIHEEVRSISAAGRYLAVLYTDRLVVYNRELQIYASLRGIGGVLGVLMQPDGSVLLLSAESASLFLP